MPEISPRDVAAAGMAGNPALAAMARSMPTAIPTFMQRATAEYPYLQTRGSSLLIRQKITRR